MNTVSIEKSSNNVIKELVKQFGEDILLEPKLYALIMDMLANKEPQLLKRIRLAISENMPKKLHALKTVGEQDRANKMRFMANVFANDYAMELEAAYSVVNYFADSLNYKTIEMTVAKSHAEQRKTSVMRITGGSEKAPQNGSIIPFGSCGWRVLDVQNDKMLIMSEQVIKRSAYNEQWLEVTWENCTLRNYLNGDFYNNFSYADKKRIVEVKNKNSANPWFLSFGGNDTSDKVFLLSIEEVIKYFGDSGQLGNKILDNEAWIMDRYSSERIATDSEGEVCWWWLRSPGNGNYRAADAGGVDGHIRINGLGVNNNFGGVRPSLWINSI